ncbi:MAG: phosphate/phosphite/phosphonate ABC transporter substrate-binding protein [Nitrospirae bacterium]|nr:phosphate/phosphite/phosphonate ABC transporter substrate-binding protein [Nitrospirota bacterium]
MLTALLLGLSIIPPSHIEAADKSAYILAVVPQVPPVEVHKRWTPFVERLSNELGINIHLKVYQTMFQFEDDIRNGVPDFAFVNPYQATIAAKEQGYIPLVRNKKSDKGIFFVRKESPFNSIKELDGKEIGFVGPTNICSLTLRHGLREKEKVHFIPKYMGTTTNVYRSVILGKVPAGGTLSAALNREPAEVRNQIRIIYETMPISPHPLMAHPRVAKDLKRGAVNTALRLAEDSKTQVLLEGILMPEPVKADYKRDYKPLEMLGLERYAIERE